MKIHSLDTAAFADYAVPLRALERAFKKSGVPVSFLAFDFPVNGKSIHIRQKGRESKIIMIEGDSPAQAVKDVAQAVHL